MEMTWWEFVALVAIVAIAFSDKLKGGAFFSKYSDFPVHK